MKPQSDNHSTEPRNLGHSSSANFSGINFGEVEAKHRMLLIQWLNSLLPTLNLPINITDDELRVCLSNGTILCQVMNKLRPGSVSEVSEFDDSPSAKSENINRFLKAIDALGMPKFELSDLEKGPMKNVVDCLLTLRAKSLQNAWGDNISMTSSKVRSITSSPSSHSKFQSVLRSPVMAEPSAALLHHVGHKFHEVFQMKQGSYAELPAAKISELMKSTSLNNAPTQSLLSVVNAILEESVERRNSEIPHRVAVLLRKVVQEIERRISTQADHLRTQNNLFKAREEKYQSRIRVLEVLASGAKDESEGAVRSPMRKQQQTTVMQPKELTEVTKMEEKKAFESIHGEKAKEETEKEDNQEVIRLIKELENKNMDISKLKQELEIVKKGNQDVPRSLKEMEDKNMEILTLKKELETMKKGKMENEKVEFSEGKQEVRTMNSDNQDVARLTRDLESKKMEIATLKQELETLKEGNQEVAGLMKNLENKSAEISTLKQELETLKKGNQEVAGLMKNLENKSAEISTLKQEIETLKKGNQDAAKLMNDLENKKTEISLKKQELEETMKNGNQDIARLMKDLENKSTEISTLKQEIETLKKDNQDVSRLKNDLKKENKEISTKKQELEDVLKNGNQDIARLMKDLENKSMEISTLKQEIETLKKDNQDVARLMKDLENKYTEISTRKQELEDMLKNGNQDIARLNKDLGDKTMEISTLKQELETSKKTYDFQCSQLEAEIKGAKEELKEKSQEYEHQLETLSNKVRENEASYESKYQKWNMKVIQLLKATTFQLSSIKVLKLSSETVKQHVINEQTFYAEEFKRLGVNLKPLVDAAENYQVVLAENRKLFNDIQELKGNIRVYCRVRPFLPGQKEKQSIVENYAETEMVVANPAKPGKDGLRTFKFNRVFGPTATQADVYNDIQAFIRSVLDGYNVCIFAYGQTGSGKTYTMSGPNGATAETYGVNYRALNDLFSIATTRQSTISYEIGVQVIEIYNEQVRDLLVSESSAPKKLGILTHSQPNGLAVPDASMQIVKQTSDVIKLMDIGLKNRAKSSTSMNERSSRSHSVVSINVRGLDKKTGSILQGNLHLIDLAGSERVDRSEVTGDRLKEAQHINKSLAALGDVIFALAQKNAHVPYRNSKLTQLLQSSLGGHAKTLMLVQINSDVKSYSESLSTLKFAERVSGVELGAAKSSKDAGRDVKELMEQVASLRDTILTKDAEIERLQLLKDLKS